MESNEIANDIKKIVAESAKNFNNKNNDYKIYVLKDRKEKINYDYRFINELDYNHCITTIAKDQENNVVFSSTIIVLDKEKASEFFLWKVDKEKEKINKISIDKIFKFPCLTLGYAEKIGDLSKVRYKLVKWFFKVVNKCLKEYNMDLFIELTGKYNLNRENDISYDKVKKYIGSINERSIPVLSLSKIFNLKPVNDVYEYHSLGPVLKKE